MSAKDKEMRDKAIRLCLINAQKRFFLIPSYISRIKLDLCRKTHSCSPLLPHYLHTYPWPHKTHYLNISESSSLMICSKNKYFISCCLAFPRWYIQALQSGPPDAGDLMTELFGWTRVCFVRETCHCCTPSESFQGSVGSFPFFWIVAVIPCRLLPRGPNTWKGAIAQNAHTHACKHVTPPPLKCSQLLRLARVALCICSKVCCGGLLRGEWLFLSWVWNVLVASVLSSPQLLDVVCSWIDIIMTLPLFFSISNSPGGSQLHSELFKINKIMLLCVANTKWKQGKSERLADRLEFGKTFRKTDVNDFWSCCLVKT